jgi:hypothetical protein
MKDSIYFSSYPNLKGNENQGQVTLEQLELRVKNNPQKSTIDKIRLIRKSDKSKYDEIKRTLQIVTPHSILDAGQKLDSKVIELSGLVTIDIEEATEDTKQILFNQPEIIGVWTSTSGFGLHALASLDGLSSHTFKKYHLAYLNSLYVKFGIVADDKVCFTSAGLIVSSDPDAMFKKSWVSLDVRLLDEYVKESKNSPSLVVLDKMEEILQGVGRFSKLIFESRLPNYESPVVYIPEGRPYLKCYLPFDCNGRPTKIKTGSRNLVLSSYLQNLIILNPLAERSHFLGWMTHINNTFCQTPLHIDEVAMIVDNKLKNRSNLKPLSVKTKRYWIDPDYKGSKIDLFNSYRKDRTQSLVDEWFEVELGNYDTKVTQELICKEIGIGHTTLKRYLSPVHKNILKEHNNSIKK